MSVAARRAIEALRAGVPNRDAVLALGCSQDRIERRFIGELDTVKRSLGGGGSVGGMLVSGDFGAGKSHLFEYLQQLALRRNFVCSKVVVSKETPLFDPVKLYRTAVEAAVVPHGSGEAMTEIVGSAMTEIAMRLRFDSPVAKDFAEWVAAPVSGLSAQFAALLHVYEQRQNDPDVSQRILRFWAGEALGTGEIKRYLKECGAAGRYQLDRPKVGELALQRFRFAPRLFAAAGYAGWIVLVDEVELIGRYSMMQRARSYAAVARWLGDLRDEPLVGLGIVMAATADFASEVIQGKGDREKIPAKLRRKGGAGDALLASQAERGMALLAEPEALGRPSDATITESYRRIRAIYQDAYGWVPPDIPLGERLTTKPMRQYVKSWITEWDLRRRYPGSAIEVVVSPDAMAQQGYEEDRDLEGTPEEHEGS